MKRTLIYILLLLPIQIFSQENLALNGNFIDTISCPPKISTSNYSYFAYWFSSSTPDFFHKCSPEVNSQGSVHVPDNYRGAQPALSKNSYIGLYFSVPFLNSREYITGHLKAPLLKDTIYQVSFFISTADNSKHAIDKIGVYLSVDSIYQNNDNMLSYIPQVESDSGKILDYKTSWHEIKGIFKANGGEKYITLGCFREWDKLKWKTYNPPTYIGDGAYYYIDSVSVLIYHKPDTIIPSKKPSYNLFPNPTSNEIIIEFKDIEPNQVKLELYDIIGRKVTIRESQLSGSKYNTNISFLASGAYVYRIIVDGEFMGEGKLIILKQ